jgi:hypothetical protein
MHVIRPIANEITDAIRNAKDRLPGAVLIVKHIKRQNGEYCSLNKNPAMKIYRKEDGWYFHCFRCGYQGFISDGGATPFELKARWKALQSQKSKESLEQITLPEDFIPMLSGNQLEIPAEAWHWFWQYQLSAKVVAQHRIGWSNTYQRVIIPCNKTEILTPSGDYAYKLLGWTGREVMCKDKEERNKKGIIKYLTKKSAHVKHLFFHTPVEGSDRVVLVEDIISAMKISSMTNTSAIALLTTYIPPSLMVKLRRYHITIWLDGDMLAKAVNYVSMYGQRGFNVGHITTPKDPKCYTFEELNEHLKTGGSND